MAGVDFEIVETGAALGKSGSWTVEINKVSWNGNEPKWDIRPWNEDHSRCGKGITLTEEQMMNLREFITD